MPRRPKSKDDTPTGSGERKRPGARTRRQRKENQESYNWHAEPATEISSSRQDQAHEKPSSNSSTEAVLTNAPVESAMSGGRTTFSPPYPRPNVSHKPSGVERMTMSAIKNAAPGRYEAKTSTPTIHSQFKSPEHSSEHNTLQFAASMGHHMNSNRSGRYNEASPSYLKDLSKHQDKMISGDHFGKSGGDETGTASKFAYPNSRSYSDHRIVEQTSTKEHSSYVEGADTSFFRHPSSGFTPLRREKQSPLNNAHPESIWDRIPNAIVSKSLTNADIEQNFSEVDGVRLARDSDALNIQTKERLEMAAVKRIWKETPNVPADWHRQGKRTN